jgi:hypothetical protein
MISYDRKVCADFDTDTDTDDGDDDDSKSSPPILLSPCPQALFRPVSMVVPDLALICEIMLMAEGFQVRLFLWLNVSR